MHSRPRAHASSEGFRNLATITDLLGKWRQGDQEALSNLMAQLNGQLRELARIQFMRERADHTLQPTALINELYLKLIDGVHIRWSDRNHFFAVSASIMRRILVDHARKKSRRVESGRRFSLTLADQLFPQFQNVDLIDLDRALTRLKHIDEHQHRVAELRLFAGLSTPEIADFVGVTQRTIQRKWAAARIWLYAHIQDRL